MILYHGSNIAVTLPRLLEKQRDLDFGKGFYTTGYLEQAVKWANRCVAVRKTGKAIVSCYEVDDEIFQSLKVLRFSKPDFPWLDYVAANRTGKSKTEEWDVVYGPVANDQTFPTILFYLEGYFDAETTIKNLLPQKLKDQYAFKTEKAIAMLKLKEVIE